MAGVTIAISLCFSHRHRLGCLSSYAHFVLSIFALCSSFIRSAALLSALCGALLLTQCPLNECLRHFLSSLLVCPSGRLFHHSYGRGGRPHRGGPRAVYPRVSNDTRQLCADSPLRRPHTVPLVAMALSPQAAPHQRHHQRANQTVCTDAERQISQPILARSYYECHLWLLRASASKVRLNSLLHHIDLVRTQDTHAASASPSLLCLCYCPPYLCDPQLLAFKGRVCGGGRGRVGVNKKKAETPLKIASNF